jgi:hypothetical protein
MEQVEAEVQVMLLLQVQVTVVMVVILPRAQQVQVLSLVGPVAPIGIVMEPAKLGRLLEAVAVVVTKSFLMAEKPEELVLQDR